MSQPQAFSPFACAECGTNVDAQAASCSSCEEVRPRGGWPLDPFLGRTVLSRFRIVRRIGAGASSEVFAAEDDSLPGDAGPVVVKVLSGHMSDSARKRFINELRAVRRLHGAHVVKVYDAGIDAGLPCIVMEYLDGVSLKTFLKNDPGLARSHALTIVAAIAEALDEAHSKGVVHRDIKPDNIFLCGATYFVKVLDFGAACVLGPESTHSSVGTPRYMAPEQIEQRAVDARTDVYSLGVVLFELLTGTPPFTGSVSELLLAHLHQPAPTVLERDAESDPELSAFVASMLAKDPAARPSSMADVHAYLTQVPAVPLREEPPVAPLVAGKIEENPGRVSLASRLSHAWPALAVLAVFMGGFATWARFAHTANARGSATASSAPLLVQLPALSEVPSSSFTNVQNAPSGSSRVVTRPLTTAHPNLVAALPVPEPNHAKDAPDAGRTNAPPSASLNARGRSGSLSRGDFAPAAASGPTN